jgi:FK506-binding nuclear protein
MAALDPTEPPELDENSTGPARATLKIIRQPNGYDDDDEDDDEYMREILGESDSEDEDEDEDEEANGGPSDPSKSKKARKEAALKQLMESIDTADSDEEMVDGPNGITADKKGKAKATDEDEDDEDDSDDDSEEVEVEEFVLCTLDAEKVSYFCSSMRFFIDND